MGLEAALGLEAPLEKAVVGSAVLPSLGLAATLLAATLGLVVG